MITIIPKKIDSYDLPNLNIYKEQIKRFKAFLAAATPTPGQQKDIDFLLILGELFPCVVYGQLILENAKIYNVGHGPPGPGWTRSSLSWCATSRSTPSPSARVRSGRP